MSDTLYSELDDNGILQCQDTFGDAFDMYKHDDRLIIGKNYEGILLQLSPNQCLEMAKILQEFGKTKTLIEA